MDKVNVNMTKTEALKGFLLHLRQGMLEREGIFVFIRTYHSVWMIKYSRGMPSNRSAQVRPLSPVPYIQLPRRTSQASFTAGNSSGGQCQVALSPQLYASMLITGAEMSPCFPRSIIRLVLPWTNDWGRSDCRLLKEESTGLSSIEWTASVAGMPAERPAWRTCCTALLILVNSDYDNSMIYIFTRWIYIAA